MPVKFVAIDTETARAYQQGGPDANGQRPVRAISPGGAIPCRHCLTPVAKGEEYLILSHRPFASDQPYAERGPIFLHAENCARAIETPDPAPMHRIPGFHYILRGYGANGWINYDVADVVPAGEVAATAERMLMRDDVEYLHMRSSRYNCFQCRVERA